MKKPTHEICQRLIKRYPVLQPCQEDIIISCKLLIDCFASGHKLLVCGNGGSAADSLHITGELMKAFILPRPLQGKDKEAIMSTCSDAQYLLDNLEVALPVLSLVSETALITAYSNDRAPDLCFAQQVLGYGNEDDILLAISTSGNSRNVIFACEVAQAKGLKVILLTGGKGGRLALMVQNKIVVPAFETYAIQELHLPVYHCLCEAVENEFFGVEQ